MIEIMAESKLTARNKVINAIKDRRRNKMCTFFLMAVLEGLLGRCLADVDLLCSRENLSIGENNPMAVHDTRHGVSFFHPGNGALTQSSFMGISSTWHKAQGLGIKNYESKHRISLLGGNLVQFQFFSLNSSSPSKKDFDNSNYFWQGPQEKKNGKFTHKSYYATEQGNWFFVVRVHFLMSYTDGKNRCWEVRDFLSTPFSSINETIDQEEKLLEFKIGVYSISIKSVNSESTFHEIQSTDINYKYFSENWQEELENLVCYMMIGRDMGFPAIKIMRNSLVALSTQNKIEQRVMGGVANEQTMKELLIEYGPNGIKIGSKLMSLYFSGFSRNFFYNENEQKIHQKGGNYVLSIYVDMTEKIVGESELLQLYIEHERRVISGDIIQTRIIKVEANFTKVSSSSSNLMIRVKKYDNVYQENLGIIAEMSETVFEKLMEGIPELVYSLKIGAAFVPTYFEKKESQNFEFNNQSGEKMAFIAYCFFGIQGLRDSSYEEKFVTHFFIVNYAYRVKEDEKYSFELKGNVNEHSNDSLIYLEEYLWFRGGVVSDRVFYGGREVSFRKAHIRDKIFPKSDPNCFYAHLNQCMMCKKKRDEQFIYTGKKNKCSLCPENTGEFEGCSQCFDDKLCQKCEQSNYFVDPFRRGKCRAFSERCPHGKGSYNPILGNLIYSEFQYHCLTCPLNCKKCFDFPNTQALCSECFQGPGIAETQQDGTCKCLKTNCDLCERYDCDKCSRSSETIPFLESSGDPGGDNPSFSCRPKDPTHTCGISSTNPPVVASAFSATDPDTNFFCYPPNLNTCEFIVGNRCNITVIEGPERSLNLTGAELENPVELSPDLFSNCNEKDEKYLTYQIQGNLRCHKITSNQQAHFGCLVKNLTNDCKTCEGEGTPFRIDSMRYTCGCPLGKFFIESMDFCDTCLENCDICQNKNECLKCKRPLILDENLICRCSTDNCKSCTLDQEVEECQECEAGFKLENSLCVVKCSTGYYESIENQVSKCLKCPIQSCKTCTAADADSCQECQLDLFLSADKETCSYSCENPYYETVEELKNICKICTERCVTCLNSSTCLNCEQGLFITEDGQCVEECRSGEYTPSNGERKCLKCLGISCKTCDQMDPEICLSCDDHEFFTLEKQCMETCPLGTRGDTDLMICDTCEVAECGICQKDKAKCQKCKNGKKLSFDGLVCLESCKEQGELEDPRSPGICVKCSQNTGLDLDKPVVPSLTVQEPCSFCKIPGCNNCFEDNSVCCLDDNLPCTKCNLESDYYFSFRNCDRCWVDENGKPQCPEPYNYELTNKEGQKNFGEIEISFTPPLPTDRIKSTNFSLVFRLRSFEGEVGQKKNVQDIPLGNFQVRDGVQGNSSKLLLTFTQPEQNPKLWISLRPEKGKNGVILHESKIGEDPESQEFIYIVQKDTIIKLKEQVIQPTGVTKAIADTMSPNDGVVAGLSFIDPSGALVKASQMIKVVNKFALLNVTYGKELGPFLEDCIKISEIGNRTNEVKFSKGFRQKFSIFMVALRLTGTILNNAVVYFGSWLLKIIELLMISRIKKSRQHPSKTFTFCLQMIRKVKFTIFCSFSPKIVFFGTRMLFHSTTKREQIPEKSLLSVCLILIIIDYALLLENIRMILKHKFDKSKLSVDDGVKDLNGTRVHLNQSQSFGVNLDDGSILNENKEEIKDGNTECVGFGAHSQNAGASIGINSIVNITKGPIKRIRMNNKIFYGNMKKKGKLRGNLSPNPWLQGPDSKIGDTSNASSQQQKNLDEYSWTFGSVNGPPAPVNMPMHHFGGKQQGSDKGSFTNKMPEMDPRAQMLVDLDQSLTAFNLYNLKQVENNPISLLAVSNNYFFLIKTTISQLLIVANPRNASINLFLLISLELAQTGLNFYCHFWLKSFEWILVIIQKLAQNIGLLAIFIMIWVLKSKNETENEIGKLDRIVKIAIVYIVAVEYALCLVQIVARLVWWSCKKPKRRVGPMKGGS